MSPILSTPSESHHPHVHTEHPVLPQVLGPAPPSHGGAPLSKEAKSSQAVVKTQPPWHPGGEVASSLKQWPVFSNQGGHPRRGQELGHGTAHLGVGWAPGQREPRGAALCSCAYPGEARPLTDGEEGGVGEASLAAGDVVDGGVDESTLEPVGVASSESPLGRNWDGAESAPFCPDIGPHRRQPARRRGRAWGAGPLVAGRGRPGEQGARWAWTWQPSPRTWPCPGHASADAGGCPCPLRPGPGAWGGGRSPDVAEDGSTIPTFTT